MQHNERAISFSRTLYIALAVFSVCIAAFGADADTAASGAKLVAPWYPPKKNIVYAPSTVPANTLFVTLKNGVPLTAEAFDETVSLDGKWKISGLESSDKPFDASTDMDKGYQGAEFSDSAWDTIEVPLDWYIKYPQFRKTGAKPYVKGWYRKAIAIPESKIGKRVILTFDVMSYEATLFVNGKKVGTHHGAFTPWTIDVTEQIVFGADNHIAIRVFSDFGPNFGASHAKHTYGTQFGIEMTKGGIWQKARLTYQKSIYVKRALMTPLLASSSVDVDYCIVNTTGSTENIPLHAVVYSAMTNAKGKEIANSEIKTIALAPGENLGRLTIALSNPIRWSPDNPYLYYCTLALVGKNGGISCHSERFGFRDFKAKGKYFFLNGEKHYIFGENIIENIYIGGYGKKDAEDDAFIANMLCGFRAQGYTMLRTSHMPIIPRALELADEIGMMIYDEWGWCFTSDLDQDFEKNNLVEVSEWVHRDYNNPCVVMWSCGNEIKYENKALVRDNLNKQVLLVRKLDDSGRPVSVFSGSGSDIYGKERMQTDLIDLHTYLGLVNPPWTHWDDELTKLFSKFINPVYGERGMVTMPFLIQECVGFQWGGLSDKSFSLNNIDAYARYARTNTSGSRGNGIGFSATLGLAAALDPSRGLPYGRNVYGKRITDFIRTDIDRIQGFAPWFYDYKTPAATLWTQPVYVSLRGTNNIPFRNIFDNRSYAAHLMIANSHTKDYRDLSVVVTLVNTQGIEANICESKIPALTHFTRVDMPVSLSIPAKITPGFHQIRALVSSGGVEISRNFYDVFIQSEVILSVPVVTAKKTALIGNSNDSTAAILTALNVPFAMITDMNELGKYQALIVSAASHMHSLFETPDTIFAILKWVRAGGTFLILEQQYAEGKTPLGNLTIKNDNTFVDVMMTEHSVFKGLAQENFDTWDNERHGNIINYSYFGFSSNALAVRGIFLGDRGVNSAVVEGTLGQGRIFASQIAANEHWGKDSAASTYLRNVLEYCLGKEETFSKTQPWQWNIRRFIVAQNSVVSIDLTPYANQGFADEVDGDKKGGWTDQGENDFRNMPLGNQTFVGVPFSIINPEMNKGKSCIVLGNKTKDHFPRKVNGIVVNGIFSSLFFLHTMAWATSSVGEYRIHFSDNSVETVKLVDGKNIGDWWSPGDLQNAFVACTKENKSAREVGLYAMKWENPKPDLTITSIDFESYGNAVPILVAISGEKVLTAKETLAAWDFSGMAEIPKSIGNYTDPQSGAKVFFSMDTNAVSPVGSRALKILVETPSMRNSSTDIQLSFNAKTSIATKTKYRISFWCKATTPMQAKLTFIGNESPWKMYADPGDAVFSADVEWKKITVDLEGAQKLADKLLRAPGFYLGAMPKGTALWLTGVKFEEL